MLRTYFYYLGAVFILAALTGCSLKWKPAWQEAGSDMPTQTSRASLALAEEQYDRISDKQSLQIAIKSYEKVLGHNPGDYQALVKLSSQYILMGTAYTRSRSEKSSHFRRAMEYTELAMYTNPDFRQHVDAGATPWQSAELLTQREKEAMFFWVTAMQYEFKESMSLPAKVINIRWLQRCLVFLDRIEIVAPEFGGGAVEFAKVICYYALPKNKGGSKKLGDIYMDKAVKKGERRLLPRWARGKYYHVINNNKDNARQDLEWVASRNIDEFEDSQPWKIHFHENAQELLEKYQ